VRTDRLAQIGRGDGGGGDDEEPTRHGFSLFCAECGRDPRLSGVPWARIGEHVGQRSLRVTADTYSHVLVDEAELDYAELLT
jgi:hypothetical protein